MADSIQNRRLARRKTSYRCERYSGRRWSLEHSSLLLLAMVSLTSCIDVKDLRDAQSSGPQRAGQVDTGWAPNPTGPRLPPSIACDTDSDCNEWLADLPCLTAECLNNECSADPMADGTPCSDRDYRTQGDLCTQGLCVAGPSVCVCDTDDKCAEFDDGNSCNERMVCDGCSCHAIKTAPGAPCDDGNPATTNDHCIDEDTCLGTVPCQCTENSDCPTQTCSHSVCEDCICRVHPGVAGLIYSSESFDNGLPDQWTNSSTNDAITWQPDGAGGIRATGIDGSYDYGATETTLRSTPVLLPPGIAVLKLVTGLHSGEDGCDDRIEIHINDTLLDTICSSTPNSERTYPLTGDQEVNLSIIFIANAVENTGAGAFVDDIRWIRAQPNDCPIPHTELLVPKESKGLQTSPEIGNTSTSDWFVVWQGPEGTMLRMIDQAGVPNGEDSVLDVDGTQATVDGDWIAWKRNKANVSQIVVHQVSGLSNVLTETDPAHSPSISASGPTVAYLAESPAGRVVRQLNLTLDDTPMDITGPDNSLMPPRIVTSGDQAWTLTANDSGLVLHSGTSKTTLYSQAISSPPDLAAGHQTVTAVWPTLNGISVQAGENSTTVQTQNSNSPRIVSVASGWFIIWTVIGEKDSGVNAAFLTPEFETIKPLSVAKYTFGDQDSPALAPADSNVMAVWRTHWFDGDASGIVIKQLKPPVISN